jgi:L-fucose isomerase-like protein
MKKIKVGYVSLAKTSFDMELAEEFRSKAISLLNGFNNVDLVDAGQLITLEPEAANAAKMFKEKQIDALVVHYCAFSLGALTPAMVAGLNVPVILLSTPEVNFEGDRLRSNSFCAMNLNSFTLYKMKRKYRYIFKSLDDNSIVQDFQVIFTALQTLKNLQNAKVGLIGARAPGFYTSNFDELKLLNELGVEVEHIDISRVYNRAGKLSPQEVRDESESLLKSINYQTKVTSNHLENLIRTRAAFSGISQDFNLDALAVKCWPEFHGDYGTPACAAIGMMNSKLPAAAEGDVYGTVTMLMQRYITGEIPFFSDFIYSDTEKNTGIFWHCGCGSMELAGDKSEIVLDNFPGKVKGAPEKGCVMSFQIYAENKRATVNQFGTDCDGNFRMLDISGKNIKYDTVIRGNYCQLKFDSTVEAIRKEILDNGFGHHYSLVLQDISEVMGEIAFWKDFKLYHV